MQPAKQEAMQTIAKLPENVDMEEIIYRLYILEKIRKGREDVAQSRFSTADDLKREIEQW
ncbi:MAG: hypothetical protein DM484_16455 [Candidatus Methylumidiphilus alinenensis]|uniref:Uncharacterized protein n=1 Tax=Candidatus Methylumidiphilus alinenensis TaxID=2202197 RepID=A0A2W4QZ45_9GAMM|nr:MAG: hypothetical protein DM484_16455 [Candidatus Methylumidiphilus alinenensis]